MSTSYTISVENERGSNTNYAVFMVSCHERIRTIAPVIEVNSIEELSEVVKQLYIHSCSTGA